jgi:hypothetical protein
MVLLILVNDQKLQHIVESLASDADETFRSWKETCSQEEILSQIPDLEYERTVVDAVLDALSRPQLLDIQEEPTLAVAAGRFARSFRSVGVGIRMFLCLAVTIARQLADGELEEETVEIIDRLRILVSRAETTAVGVVVSQLDREADRDPVTGLYNRRAFDRHFPDAIARALDRGEDLS